MSQRLRKVEKDLEEVLRAELLGGDIRMQDSRSVIHEWDGDIRPIASNQTEAGRQMNRRIEIVLYAGAL